VGLTKATVLYLIYCIAHYYDTPTQSKPSVSAGRVTECSGVIKRRGNSGDNYCLLGDDSNQVAVCILRKVFFSQATALILGQGGEHHVNCDFVISRIGKVSDPVTLSNVCGGRPILCSHDPLL